MFKFPRVFHGSRVVCYVFDISAPFQNKRFYRTLDADNVTGGLNGEVPDG